MIIGACAAIALTTVGVLGTRRIGIRDWQFSAICALVACSYVMGVMS